LIEQALNWGSHELWTNEDFENLSENIFDKTSVRLSVSTLKRIWGKVRYESSPNTATLNALAAYLGYENWRSFQQKNPLTEEVVKEAVAFDKRGLIEQRMDAPRKKRISVPMVSVAVLSIICVALISIFGGRKSDIRTGPPNVVFETREVSDDLPNSVVFNYDASGYHSDSVYLQQSWDQTRREKLDTGGRQHTSIYYYPGYFRAKLIVDGQIKKQSGVFIKTKGWKGIIERNPMPIYLDTAAIKGKGFMGISKATLREEVGSPVFTNTWVSFSNVRQFDNIDAAAFSFETTLRNTSTVTESLCRKVSIDIMGTKSPIIIPLSAKGCISELNLMNGTRLIMGKQTDLSAFGCDIGNFQHLKCTVENKRLKIWLNDKLILEVAQTETIGDVVGVSIAFEGTGEIKDVKLYSPGKAAAMDEAF